MASEASDEADREIVVSRTIEAPRRSVYEAFTSASHLAQWCAPRGGKITTHAFDFKPGGVWDATIQGPDGSAYPNHWLWKEIVPPERIVWLYGSGKDMERSKRFYTDGLGWKIQNDYKISVFFVPHGGSLVGFYGREGLAADVGVDPHGSGFPGVVMNYIVRSEARVDEVMDEAKKAGAKILKPAAKLQWGGYGGSFADPDGYVWRVGYSAQGSDQPYAE